MVSEFNKYSLDEYQNILFSGISYQLPEAVIKTIEELEVIITQIATNAGESFEKSDKRMYESGGSSGKYIEKRNRFSKFEKKMNTSVEDVADWNSGKTFKIVPKVVKEGVEKLLDDIRISLNKLSNKNFETQQEQITQNIQKILEETENKEDDIKKITKTIFDTAVSNKFYSELYADLYNKLIKSFDVVFKEQLGDLINNYKKSINEIFYVDPNKDYDGYCEYTKKNDMRKAVTAFIVNLVKKQILIDNDVLDIVIYLEDLVMQYATEDARTNEIEEIVENLFILITQSNSLLENTDMWQSKIIPRVNELSKIQKLDSAKYKSMTMRASFKLMDILDKLKPK